MRGIEDLDNIEAPSTDYPNGRIKDRTGTAHGTPVNEKGYGDLFQFIAKLFRARGVNPNSLPDNVTNGFQLFDVFESTESGGNVSDAVFNFSVINHGCTTTLSQTFYRFIKTGRKIEFNFRFSVTINTTGGSNNWFDIKITPKTAFKGIPSSKTTSNIVNSNSYDAGQNNAFECDTNGDLVLTYDNTYVAVAGQTYVFMVMGSYLIPNQE